MIIQTNVINVKYYFIVTLSFNLFEKFYILIISNFVKIKIWKTKIKNKIIQFKNKIKNQNKMF